MSKQLIVNADDYGYSKGVSRGILEAAEAGIVTATSAMPLRANADDARRIQESGLSVGLHLELDDAPEDRKWLQTAMKEQLARFQDWLGREPNQIDSHHHTHLRHDILEVLCEFARELDLPVRAPTPETVDFLRGRGVKTPDFFLGGPEPFIQWNADALHDALEHVPEGMTELCCHPGYVTDDLVSSYREGRTTELKALTSTTTLGLVDEKTIELVSWKALT